MFPRGWEIYGNMFLKSIEKMLCHFFKLVTFLFISPPRACEVYVIMLLKTN